MRKYLRCTDTDPNQPQENHQFHSNLVNTRIKHPQTSCESLHGTVSLQNTSSTTVRVVPLQLGTRISVSSPFVLEKET